MNLEDRRRALATDVLLAVGLFVAALGSVAVWDAGDSTARTPDTWSYALIGLQTLPLIWRRQAPVSVLSITIVGFILDRGLDYPGSWAIFV